MSGGDWVKGYAAAITDLEGFLGSRMKTLLDGLFADIRADAQGIDHAIQNKAQREKLRAAAQRRREADGRAE